MNNLNLFLSPAAADIKVCKLTQSPPAESIHCVCSMQSLNMLQDAEHVTVE